jgi:hypothetical protein
MNDIVAKFVSGKPAQYDPSLIAEAERIAGSFTKAEEEGTTRRWAGYYGEKSEKRGGGRRREERKEGEITLC